MKITKYGHACILVEVDGTKLVVDPGSWNVLPEVDSLDAILVTHEHQDHFDIEQVKSLVSRHPKVRIITHEAVGKHLTEAGSPHGSSVGTSNPKESNLWTWLTASLAIFNRSHALS